MHVPVKTDFADWSAKSNAVFPSVFRMFGSAPCWSKTETIKDIDLPFDHHGLYHVYNIHNFLPVLSFIYRPYIAGLKYGFLHLRPESCFIKIRRLGNTLAQIYVSV